MPLRKEATARIKINRLLEAAGWRFFDDKNGPANVVLEPNVKLKPEHIESLGEDFEKSAKGFIDFLLLDKDGKPLIVLEAKSEDKDPRIGKEQARKYARAQNARFVILSNGNIHYLWDLEQAIRRSFLPSLARTRSRTTTPSSQTPSGSLPRKSSMTLSFSPRCPVSKRGGVEERGGARCFRRKAKAPLSPTLPGTRDPGDTEERQEGSTRFLFEMATGTGKTLTSAAVIKLFLKTRNAKRVLFLVDRLNWETQADKAFKAYLKNDFTSIIYKEQRDDWRKADIVVTTVQSLLFNDKFRRLFSPTDFDLVISDEAHRSIGGNARAVFEYFIGYKLGLTATPKDYLKQSKKDKPKERDLREAERRMMLDTYRTFGCESGDPTFRYSLLDGVREGFLINPYVIDARNGCHNQAVVRRRLHNRIDGRRRH